MNENITFIMNKFPTYRTKILDCYNSNEDFQGLCEDFYSSAKNLELCRKGELEYQALLHDLEKEIVKFLERTNAGKAT